jgi:hypothetical protein
LVVELFGWPLVVFLCSLLFGYSVGRIVRLVVGFYLWIGHSFSCLHLVILRSCS